MKFLVVFSCVLAVALAKPGLLGYAIVPGAPIGPDGRVIDTAEVAHAKAEHAAAHINEKINLNNEALRSADYLVAGYSASALPVAHGAPLAYAAAPAALPIAHHAAPLTYSAPLAYASGPLHASVLASDGRPLDTPEVALAKASHAAAHINDKIRNAQEATRNLYHI